MTLLEAYDWPGNVRELQSVVREALIVSAGPTVRAEFLPVELHARRNAEPEPDLETEPVPTVDQEALAEFVNAAIACGETDVYRRALEHFDRLLISRPCITPTANRIVPPKSWGSAELHSGRNSDTCNSPWRKS